MSSPDRYLTRCAGAFALALLAACGDHASSGTDPHPRPEPTPVDVVFCTGAQPIWLAFQDGEGAWTRAQPTIAGSLATFHLGFTENRGAVAMAQRFANLTSLSIQYGAPAELSTAGTQRPEFCGLTVSKTLNGTVAGIDTNEAVTVIAGRSTREETTVAEGSSFILHAVSDGPQDVFATRLTRIAGKTTLTGYIRRHNPDLPDGATMPALDFGSAEAFAPEERTLTLEDFGVEGAISFVGFRPADGDNVVTFGTDDVTEPTRRYFAVPAARLEPGDLQFFSATTAASNTSNVARALLVYFRSPSNRTLSFAPVPDAPEITFAATTPTVRPRARFDDQPDYDRATGISYQQGERVVAVLMTASYAALTGGYDLTVPDLAATEGFDPAWGLVRGSSVLWRSARIGGTLPLGADAAPTNNSARWLGTDAGFLQP